VVQRISQEIRVKHYPAAMPNEDNLELVKVTVTELKEGEFLVRNIWMAVDPICIDG